ncbi:MAG: IS66 family insertion sequence element accessory protein TnpB [Marinobacter sp.]|uniref:IS66 family insertion sequence element accessory protein TnpB n=1 Tax=Marinobacter sp. TaxID=50741 RepID=UPI001B6FFC32|nr:IS66 family insertion sequence element accessory protein TnpB [Marinobacter sp.]MBQ0746140.1 IS66 family insertion sequence element accessory protein TnpB [Marinobacter sp.]MBQ0815508.1 IS66 family insertion sequence element accessory protein TnpB [Marinobacter sp.]
MIRIDEIWLATEPLDMRAGPDTALARVVQVFGSARPHCAYLFANKRGNRMKVLIHDGLGIWLCARRLNRGKFHWGETWRGKHLLSNERAVGRTVARSALAASWRCRCDLGFVTTSRLPRPSSEWRIVLVAMAWHAARYVTTPRS